MVFEVDYEQHFYIAHKPLGTQSLFDMRAQLDVHSRTDVAYTSGNWWESAQPLYNIIIFSMCIHMHHFDIHLDHVSYSMGVFRVMVISISLLYLWSTQSICLFLSCHIIIALLNAYDPNTQSLLDVIKCTYHHSHLCMCSDLSLFLLWSDFPIVIIVGTIISSLMVLSLVNSILLIYLTKLDQLSLADIYDHVLLCLQ